MRPITQVTDVPPPMLHIKSAINKSINNHNTN